MTTTIDYSHILPDKSDSIDLEVTVDFYIPRNPDVDDVSEIEILEAVIFGTDVKFDTSLLDEDKVFERVMEVVL